MSTVRVGIVVCTSIYLNIYRLRRGRRACRNVPARNVTGSGSLICGYDLISTNWLIGTPDTDDTEGYVRWRTCATSTKVPAEKRTSKRRTYVRARAVRDFQRANESPLLSPSPLSTFRVPFESLDRANSFESPFYPFVSLLFFFNPCRVTLLRRATLIRGNCTRKSEGEGCTGMWKRGINLRNSSFQLFVSLIVLNPQVVTSDETWMIVATCITLEKFKVFNSILISSPSENEIESKIPKLLNSAS